MSEQSCRLCGCTDEYGCEEICFWVEPDLCSVCSGATPRRHRHYTRTAIMRQAANPVPTEALAIYDPDASLVGAAWNIADAQLIARALDAFASAQAATEQKTSQRWQRGPIARRPNTHL